VFKLLFAGAVGFALSACATGIVSSVAPAPAAGDATAAAPAVAAPAPTRAPESSAARVTGVSVGEPFVDFGLRALSLETGTLGDVIWLSDFVGTGERKAPKRLLLLSFFATWCAPCFTELTQINEWQRAYAERGLQVVSVNFRLPDENADESMQRTRALLGAMKPMFPVLFDRYTQRNQVVYLGTPAVLPSNVLIGEDGTVLLHTQSAAPAELEALHQRVLAELSIATEPAAASAEPSL
jgi:thiol-disulfide isomerase/thioredoxin